MRIAFVNPQGNFDPNDSYWTAHPDFGGQLVYVKQLALAMAEQGHQVDILTRRIIDPQWPEFAQPFDAYPDAPHVRIVRLPCGPDHFLPKEELWPHLVQDWVPNILGFYKDEGNLPDAITAHYGDGGLAAVLINEQSGVPFTFTAHSLGAQKMDKLQVSPENLADMNARFRFARRIVAERLAMNRSALNITSTRQERMDQYNHPAYRGAADVTDDQRFAIIPPGVNRRIFSPEPTSSDEIIQRRIEAAIARDIAEDRRHLPLVICSSRLDRKKNHLGLVRAFAQSGILRATANLAIVVRGLDDPLRQRDQLSGDEQAILNDIVAILDEKKLWGIVTSFPLNNQGELAAAYRYLASRRSVFALTALYEPFGLAPLEAMSCGLPAVVTRKGGPSESMRQGNKRFGVLVDPTDPGDVARGLIQALMPEEAWRRYQEAGIHRVVSRYTWQRTAENYLAAIRSIVADPTAYRGVEQLPIPSYFRDPQPETDIPLEELEALYFGQPS